MILKLFRMYCHANINAIDPSVKTNNKCINWLAIKLKHTDTNKSTKAILK